jgi:hypothetical protein
VDGVVCWGEEPLDLPAERVVHVGVPELVPSSQGSCVGRPAAEVADALLARVEARWATPDLPYATAYYTPRLFS